MYPVPRLSSCHHYSVLCTYWGNMSVTASCVRLLQNLIAKLVLEKYLTIASSETREIMLWEVNSFQAILRCFFFHMLGDQTLVFFPKINILFLISKPVQVLTKSLLFSNLLDLVEYKMFLWFMTSDLLQIFVCSLPKQILLSFKVFLMFYDVKQRKFVICPPANFKL